MQRQFMNCRNSNDMPDTFKEFLRIDSRKDDNEKIVNLGDS